MVAEHHYAQGGPNTAVFRHGLFHIDDPMTCLGIAWWLPPTRVAAESVCANWRGVLTLTRLVVHPDVPQNGASFLLAASVKLIRQDSRWECLVTYADMSQGHTGAIYRAAGWRYIGQTAAEQRWVDASGRQVSRKAGPKSRTRAEMLALGHIAQYASPDSTCVQITFGWPSSGSSVPSSNTSSWQCAHFVMDRSVRH
jgi:hypothetical protein